MAYNNIEDRLRRKLIWKYFWKRKRKEIRDNIVKYWIEIFAILWLFIFSASMYYTLLINQESLLLGYVGIALPIFVAIGSAVYLIHNAIKEFIEWIKSNWEWATEDARIELRTRSKRRNK